MRLELVMKGIPMVRRAGLDGSMASVFVAAGARSSCLIATLPAASVYIISGAIYLLAAATDLRAQTVGPTPTAAPQAEKAPPKSKARAKARGAETGPTADDAAAAAAKKKDPAGAANAVEAGVKHFTAGRHEPAIQSLTAGISSGALPPPGLARALMTRGLAYRRTGKSAQAISDLTSSLYVKGGLADADRIEASKALSETYREAGLSDPIAPSGSAGDPPKRTRTTVAGDPYVASSPAAAASLAPTPAAPASQPSGGASLTNLFGGLFGGNQRTATTAPAAEPPPSQPTAVTQPTLSTGWTSATREPTARETVAAPKTQRIATATIGPQAPVAAPVIVAPPAAVVPAAKTAMTTGGAFRAQIGLVRTQAEAHALQQRVAGPLAAAVAGARPEVDQLQVGAMGTFFRVRLGPYASAAEAQAACQRIKGAGAAAQGVDCVPVGAN